jgi:hypothetical protein
VLSETLKEELYDSVAVRGRSLRNTSTQYKVSMERVAAVVRMKQMERDWLDEVCYFPFLPLGDAQMMKQISISLEDIHIKWLEFVKVSEKRAVFPKNVIARKASLNN